MSLWRVRVHYVHNNMGTYLPKAVFLSENITTAAGGRVGFSSPVSNPGCARVIYARITSLRRRGAERVAPRTFHVASPCDFVIFRSNIVLSVLSRFSRFLIIDLTGISGLTEPRSIGILRFKITPMEIRTHNRPLK